MFAGQRYLLIVVLVLASRPASAGVAFDLRDGKDKCALSSHLEILEDPAREWSIKDVSSPKVAKGFKEVGPGVPNFGFTASAYWVRFQAVSHSERHVTWYLEQAYPLIDHFEVFVQEQDGSFSRHLLGDLQPFHQRPVKHRNLVLPISFEPNQLRWIYIKVRTTSSVQLPLTLWSPEAFLHKDHEEQVIFGLFYGVIVVMLLYHIFIYLSVRDRSYLYYVLYILSMGLFLFALDGLAFEYLWPNATWWANISVPFLIATSVFTILAFTRSFLETREKLPRLDLVARVGMGLALLCMIFAMVLTYRFAIRASVIVSIVYTITVLLGTGYALKRGFRVARFFLLSWLGFFVGALFQSFKAFGLLPSVFVTDYGIHIGMAMEVVLLSLALADRINTMKQEKEQAQAEALRIQRQATRTLEDLNRQKTVFYQNVSHELRTPLTVMLNPLESLLAGDLATLPQEVIEDRLRAMERNTQRLLRLVNQLLDLSRLESGGALVVYEERDVRAFVEQIVKGFEPFARSKGLTMELRGDADLPIAYVDPEKLDKVICNLLSNACKFTETGGSVIVRITERNNALRITVIDTGIGISDENQSKIFERFHQVEDGVSRRYEGSGIGLAIAKEMAEAMGGSLEVESEVGVGSKFIVTLPLGTDHIQHPSMIRESTDEGQESAGAEATVKALAAEVESSASSPQAQRDRGDQKEAHGDEPTTDQARLPILVVEDNPDMRALVAEICESHFKVLQAADGEEGLALIREHHPALVISDVMMPKMDGLQLLQAVRSEPAIAGTPVILLTAKTGEETRIEGLELGADDYVTKPFGSRELLARARNLVRLKEQELQLRKLNVTLEKEVVSKSAALERARLLGRFLPPEVVDLVMEAGQDLAARRRKRLTLFRLELRGFRELLEVMEPEDMAGTLNSYLSRMTDVAFAHGATVDKIVRDVVTGFFGAPESAGPQQDAVRCARMAIELWNQAVELCEGWRDLLENPPPAPTLVLTSGYATVGSFGSSARLEYAAVGGPVEEAEDLLKEVGPGQLVCSQATWKLLHEELEGELCGEVAVRSGSKRVKLYRLAGPLIAHVDAEVQPEEQEPRQADHREPQIEEPSSEADEQRSWLTGDGRLKPGTMLAKRYQVLRPLGEGAMGVVYKARDLKLVVDVAIKLVRHEFATEKSERASSRAYREVRLARLVSHSNVARIFDIVEWDGCEFISMEYIRGQTLRHRLSTEGPLPLSAGKEVILQLCAGLGAAHAAGIVHRDLKPSNIMIEHSGRVVILDFGIAKWLAAFQDRTETQGMPGTPHYMAPEQFDDAEIDQRTDIYSLGIVAFELFTGNNPFEADSPYACAYKHVKEEPPDPRELRPDLPPRLAAVILRCMQKSPLERFNTVREIAAMMS